METRLRAMAHHLTCGMTWCHLPPETGEHAMP